MSLERVFGNLIATMLMCLLLAGTVKCGRFLYDTVQEAVVVEQPDNLVELPSYTIEGENN